MRRLYGALVVAAALFGGSAAFAHHSFAVFFDEAKSVTATGVVTEFNFTNPHASITIEAEGGVVWKGETNAQTLLRRRGWTADSVHVGDTVTMDGWPARDGSNYMRVRQVTRPDGTVVGRPVSFSDDD
jgi:hypothetical protein